MLLRIQRGDFGTDFFDPLQEFPARTFIHVLPRQRRHQPCRAHEQFRIGKLDTGLFFSSHRMSGKKMTIGIAPQGFAGAGYHLRFGAADVGQQSSGRKCRAKQVDQMKDRADGRSQNHDLTAAHRVHRVDHRQVPWGHGGGHIW